MRAILFYKFLKDELYVLEIDLWLDYNIAGAFGPDQKKLNTKLLKNDTK